MRDRERMIKQGQTWPGVTFATGTVSERLPGGFQLPCEVGGESDAESKGQACGE